MERKKSWKTTASGIAALLVAGGSLVLSFLAGENITEEIKMLLSALQSLGLAVPIWLLGLNARDDDRSSEEVGAKPLRS